VPAVGSARRANADEYERDLLDAYDDVAEKGNGR
jgi:hypothetical protein